MKKSIATLVAAAMTLAACSSPTKTQPYLNAAELNCKDGYQYDCQMIPQYKAQVEAERGQQSGAVLGAIALGLGAVILGAAEGYASTRPVYVVRPCWRRYC